MCALLAKINGTWKTVSGIYWKGLPYYGDPYGWAEISESNLRGELNDGARFIYGGYQSKTSIPDKLTHDMFNLLSLETSSGITDGFDVYGGSGCHQEYITQSSEILDELHQAMYNGVSLEDFLVAYGYINDGDLKELPSIKDYLIDCTGEKVNELCIDEVVPIVIYAYERYGDLQLCFDFSTKYGLDQPVICLFALTLSGDTRPAETRCFIGYGSKHEGCLCVRIEIPEEQAVAISDHYNSGGNITLMIASASA